MRWIKDTFGPWQKEVWTEVAHEIGGEFVSGGFWKKDKIVYDYKNWRIELDTFSTGGKHRKTYTRLQTCFISLDHFQFRIYEENIFSPLSKKLGFQDIQIGNTKFDSKYMLKSKNDDGNTLKLLESSTIQKLIQSIDNIHLKIKEHRSFFFRTIPKNLFIIYFEERGILKDKQKIVNLFTLYCLILDQLVRIESASEENSNFTF